MDSFTLHHNDYEFKAILPAEIDFIKSKKISVGNIACSLDIETSSFYELGQKRNIMYAFVLGMNGRCYIGRTWKDFIHCINEIILKYDLNENKKLIFYVHNLGYEFQYIKKMFEWSKVFANDERKPIYATSLNGIEFRCSYLLTGYNLDTVAKNLTLYKVDKMVGELDYSLIRHSKTPLTEKEKKYIIHDGLVVMAKIQEEIETLGNINEIPLTKTGYVRKLCRKKCLKGSNRFEYSKLIRSLKLDSELYLLLKQAFAGGFTHANSNYVNKILKLVHSNDLTSSYPTVMLSEKFPLSNGKKIDVKSKEELKKYLRNYCCLFEVEFENIYSTCEFENYISLSKCVKCEHYTLNNGRVVEASNLTIVLTECDFEIISKMYGWDAMNIGNFYIFQKDYLPKPLIKTVYDLYVTKTELKNVEDKEKEYMNSKENVNSVYGMTVTDILKDNIAYDNLKGWYKEKEEKNKLLDDNNNSSMRFLYYPWGVWITAYARRNLFSAILELKNDYIYSDTDSVKYFNIEKHLKYFEEYNKSIDKKIRLCFTSHSLTYTIPKNKDGKLCPLGVWDYEGMYDMLKTLGAKRYMYIKNDTLNITISGVSKKHGVDYLLHEYKTSENVLKNFVDSLVFPATYIDNGEEKSATGKLTHTYLDEEQKGDVVDYLGNIGKYHELSSIHMERSGYELSLDSAFVRYLTMKGEFLK